MGSDITCSSDCNYRTAAKLYTPETWFVCIKVITNNNNNNNINVEVVRKFLIIVTINGEVVCKFLGINAQLPQ